MLGPSPPPLPGVSPGVASRHPIHQRRPRVSPTHPIAQSPSPPPLSLTPLPFPLFYREHASFWCAEYTPAAPAARLVEPAKRPASPNSGKPLRLKDLIPVNLVTADGKPCSKGGETNYICPVTRKHISHQEVVLLAVSGEVMLKEAYTRLAAPSMTCPVSGKKFKKKHVVLLVKGGTGFSSHSKVHATKYQPNMT